MATRRKKKGKNGLTGALATGVTLVIIVAGLMGWAKVNNISNVNDVYAYFKAVSDNAWKCGAGQAEWNCDTSLPTGSGNPSGSTGSDKGDTTAPDKGNGAETPKPDNSASNAPLNGSHPMVKADALKTLDTIKIMDKQEVKYDRGEWKHWTGSPCNTREEVLIHDGENVKTDPKTCKVLSGEWVDPFSKEIFTNSSKLDIDHLIPLGYAAKHGGNNWSLENKEKFANDKTHLLAVSARENRSKSDKGPGAYMPPNKDFHCDYSKIWVSTIDKYDLSIEKSDRVALTAALQKCAS